MIFATPALLVSFTHVWLVRWVDCVVCCVYCVLVHGTHCHCDCLCVCSSLIAQSHVS